ncbi:hypothetical protein QBC39DRAFT_371309 [Podospora conica]|nr:hypothetical protein QBC39DRAFT_371309 [Schizothecium conicum]
MAWDSKTSRRRQNSNVSGTSRNVPLHTRQQSRADSTLPKSAHVADPFLHDFLSPASFDPAAYLNAVLPPLQTPGAPTPVGPQQPAAVSLADLSLQAQSSLSQLNAHTTRLTTVLTQLTDDILRSGSRLAYEVELLRGETLSLSEALTDTLAPDITEFIPGGLVPEPTPAPTTTATQHSRRLSLAATPSEQPPPPPPTTTDDQPPPEPPYITSLRTLTLVRARLDAVIHTFGAAMDYTFPPSLVSVSSSFLSVSAPDDASSSSTEEKGQQVLRSLRDEVTALLANADDPIQGVEDAARRVQELQELGTVWKGTAEDKGRRGFVEGLAKLVEERHRELVKEVEGGRKAPVAAAAAVTVAEGGGEQPGAAGGGLGGYGGYGLISQLQKFRGGI